MNQPQQLALQGFFNYSADIKIVLGIVTHLLGDAGDGQVGLHQQVLGLADTAAGQVLHGRVAACLLEHMGEVIGTGVKGIAQVLKGQRLPEVIADIFRTCRASVPGSGLAGNRSVVEPVMVSARSSRASISRWQKASQSGRSVVR